MEKTRAKRILVGGLVVVAATVAFAHPGGLDANGGHNDRKSGGYHYHQPPRVGTPRADAMQASSPVRAVAGTAAHAGQASAEVEALISLLVDKGVFTRAEYVQALAREERR